MSNNARVEYVSALQARHRGGVSSLDAQATFDVVKPEFYADVTGLADDVLDTLRIIESDLPPYGLLDSQASAVSNYRNNTGQFSWTALESAISDTEQEALSYTVPKLARCPYAGVLKKKFRDTAYVEPIDNDEHGIDTLRNASYLGFVTANLLIVNLIKQMPAMHAAHGAWSPVSDLAANSAGLLREPLDHPQQWAKAFVFTLAPGLGGSDLGVVRERFMEPDIIKKYTHLTRLPSGVEKVDWSQPTETFVLQASVNVVSRMRGSHQNRKGDHITTYPAGTRLGDIEVDEPTIGCPGKKVAYWAWHKAIRVARSENAWRAGGQLTA